MRIASTIELWECGSVQTFRILDNGTDMFLRHEGPTRCWNDIPLADIRDVGLRVAPRLRRDLVLVGETELLARTEMRIRQAEQAQMWLALHIHAEDPIDSDLARDAAASLEDCASVGGISPVYRQTPIWRLLGTSCYPPKARNVASTGRR